jgi:hypothetical protein
MRQNYGYGSQVYSSRNVRNEFYAGLLFHRAGVPCDERDIECLHAAYTMLLAVIEAQKEPSNRVAGA